MTTPPSRPLCWAGMAEAAPRPPGSSLGPALCLAAAWEGPGLVDLALERRSAGCRALTPHVGSGAQNRASQPQAGGG